jgi:ABC-type transporter Mla MlaB component
MTRDLTAHLFMELIRREFIANLRARRAFQNAKMCGFSVQLKRLKTKAFALVCDVSRKTKRRIRKRKLRFALAKFWNAKSKFRSKI